MRSNYFSQQIWKIEKMFISNDEFNQIALGKGLFTLMQG